MLTQVLPSSSLYVIETLLIKPTPEKIRKKLEGTKILRRADVMGTDLNTHEFNLCPAKTATMLKCDIDDNLTLLRLISLKKIAHNILRPKYTLIIIQYKNDDRKSNGLILCCNFKLMYY